MFISLMRKNIKKNNKENSIYFLSLIISIVAFYIILSLEKQDVMQFLKEMESDAVRRLLGLISGVYVFSLFIIFFLVYFAEKYQMERRSHEYGMLLTLGMKRSRLFLWLLVQDIYGGVPALMIGLPAAIFLSEGISLITVKLTGLGIIGHRFTFSLQAVLLTVLGFLGIKLAANMILSFKMVKREPYFLLNDTQEEKLVVVTERKAAVRLLAGVIFLAAAYVLAISGAAWNELLLFAVMLLLGSVGTFLVIKGFCSVFNRKTRFRKAKGSLHIFTFRQLQDHVFLRSGSLTISSLLVLIAIACLGYGISAAAGNLLQGNSHSMDYTFTDDGGGNTEEIQKLMESDALKRMAAGYARVDVAYLPTKDVRGEDTDVKLYDYDTSQMREAAEHLEKDQREELEQLDIYRMDLHMISLSGINALHQYMGEKKISLGEKELLFYTDPEFYDGDRGNVSKAFRNLLKQHPKLKIGGEEFTVKGICSEDIVVDRSITIAFGIILPDERFMEYADKSNISGYWNIFLDRAFIEEKGLMQAIMKGNEYFSGCGLEYENYLQNIGRQVFYIVAASYLTIYLALVFLVIANTVISLQYLMQEKNDRRRYRTLICLGSSFEDLCTSAKRQIGWYFGLPLGLAAASSIFGVLSLFSGMLPASLRGDLPFLLGIAAAGILIVCMVECAYVKMVMRISRRNMMQMMEIRREE